ncbi:MAG: NADH-quinone oxidoreductase subunit NuoG, partial [Alphaproteobacteria bacterium]
GECDLQDQAYQYGKGEGEYNEFKRAVKDKEMGPLIKTQMTRCIHCTRCVRFIEDVAGTTELGAVNRGEHMEITTYLEKNVTSELSGNVIDLCPVGALTSKPYAFKARSWELKKTETIDVMDALGSNIRVDSRGLEVLRILPRLNEDINEEWLGDKSRFCYDGFKYQRLDKPYLKVDGKFKEISFDESYQKIAELISGLKPSEIGALTGSLSSLNDIFALKNLLDNIGSKNYECRLSNQKLDSKNLNEALFNSTISGIDNADSCLLIGVNPKKDAPVLNARLRKRSLTKKLVVASIGNDLDLTYQHKNLGDDLKILQEILDGTHEYCKNLSPDKNNMLIIGEDAVNCEDGEQIIKICKAIATKYNFIKDGWNGYNFLAKSTGLINGLSLGFTSQKGINDILDKAQSGEIKLLFLHNVDDEIELSKLEKTFVIYIGTNGDKAVNIANLILPASNYVEKDAFYINIEGRVQKARRAVYAPNLAKNDIDIFMDIAKKIGAELCFSNEDELCHEMSKIHGFGNYHNFLEYMQNEGEKLKISNENKFNLGSQKLKIKDYDYYLTNAITRSSRTLNKCSLENK